MPGSSAKTAAWYVTTTALADWCECLVLAERHADKASRELLTMRTGPAPQSWLR